MPVLTSHAATLRRGAYTSLTYASVLPYDVVVSGTLSATPSFPALTVAYTVSSGDYTQVQKDQLVAFYSSTGRKKGSSRVAYGSVTSTSLPIAETSAPVIDLVAGDTFTVFDAYDIRDKLVSATAEFLKDSRITLGSNTSNPPPVANAGGLWAGFVDDGETYATVALDASNSFAIDSDSSGLLTYSWDVGDGTITEGASDEASITVQFPVGFRHIYLTVTDSSNSVSHTKRVPIWVHDDTYTPLSIIISDLHSTIRDGWNATFELPVDAQSSLSDLPDGALIVIWETERYNGAKASYGNAVSNRSHIKAVLYLIKDSIHIDATSNTVVFDAVSPLAIMRLTPALAQLMVYNDSPALWSDIRGLTVNKMFHYLAYWHSTALEYFDFYWISGLDYAYARLSVESGSLADQMQDIASSINANVTCDMVGTLRVINDPNYLSMADRSFRTTTYGLTDADVISVDMTREHRGTVKHVRGQGISGDTIVEASRAVFSNAPEAFAWFGTSYETLGKQIVGGFDPQGDLNTRTGLHFAKVNSLYYGDFVPKGVKLVLPDGYHVFDPALCEFLTFTLGANTNLRGVSFDDTTRWLIDEVAIQYDELGNKTITLTMSHETFGADGATYIPPVSDTYVPPYVAPLPTPIYTPPPTGNNGLPQTPTPISRMAYVTADHQLATTNTFNSASPSWTITDLTSLSGWPSGATTSLQFMVDLASPKFVNTGTTVNGWVLNDTHIMRVMDIYGTPALDSVTALCGATSPTVNATIYRSMFAHRLRPHKVAVASCYNDGTVWVAVTSDGATWVETQVRSAHNSGSIGVPNVYVDPATANTLYVAAYQDGITNGDNYRSDAVVIMKSSDSGATWDEFYVPRLQQGVKPSIITKPYADIMRTIYRVNKYGDMDIVASETITELIYDFAADGQQGWTLAALSSGENGGAVAGTFSAGVGFISTGYEWSGSSGWYHENFSLRSPSLNIHLTEVEITWSTNTVSTYSGVSITGFGFSNIYNDNVSATETGTGSLILNGTTEWYFNCPNGYSSMPSSGYLTISKIILRATTSGVGTSTLIGISNGAAWRKGNVKAYIPAKWQQFQYAPIPNKPNALCTVDNSIGATLMVGKQYNPDFDFEFGASGWKVANTLTYWVSSLNANFPYGGFKPISTGSTTWIRYYIPADTTIRAIRCVVYGVADINSIIISNDASGTDVIESIDDTIGTVLWNDSHVGDIKLISVTPTETAINAGTYIHLKFPPDVSDDTTTILHAQFITEFEPDKYGVFLTGNSNSDNPTWTPLVTPSSSVAWREGILQTAGIGILYGTNGKIGRFEGTTVTDKTGNSTATGDVVGVGGG